MHTENDLRAVLDEWADAAVERTDEFDRSAPRRTAPPRPKRWVAPLAAAAAVAAAAITVTAVAGHGPTDSPAAEPGTTPTATSSAPSAPGPGPQRVAANFRRLLHGTGAITDLHGRSYGKSIEAAFDYDDGHGVTGVQIRIEYQPQNHTRPSTTGANPDTGHAAYFGILDGTHSDPDPSDSSRLGNEAEGWRLGSLQAGGRVVLVGFQNRPNGSSTQKTRTTRLLSDDQLAAVAMSKSWADIRP